MHGAARSSSVRPLALGDLDRPSPPARFLGNGDSGVLLTSAGTGASWWRDHALTAWRGDRIEDRDGLFLYLRDPDRDAIWSLGRQPAGGAAEQYDARRDPGRFEIRQTHEDVEARLEVCVAPQDPVEIRRVTIRNTAARRRRLEITTYAEVVLHHPAAHAAHPVFSKLFVQTELAPDRRTILVRRRPRSPEESHPWLFHTLIEREGVVETSRDRFLGRGGRIEAPRGVVARGAGPGMTGNVLDPIVSLGDTVVLDPGAEVLSTFLLGVGGDRETALDTVRQFATRDAVDTAFAAAARAERARVARTELSEADAEYFQSLAGAILYGDPALRADPARWSRIRRSPADAGRWRRALDRPLALFVETPDADAALTEHVARGARYWSELGVPIEVLFVGSEETLRRVGAGGPDRGAPGTILAGELTDEELSLLRATARLVIEGGLPDLGARTEETARAPELLAAPTTDAPAGGARPATAASPTSDREGAARATANVAAAGGPRDEAGEDVLPEVPHPAGLEFFSGFGGFAEHGREYVIPIPCAGARLRRLPPRPWINVIANEHFGSLVSETGAGTTWSRNSREHRLTPWSNDPILDPLSEGLWIRDDDTGAFGSPLPGPSPWGGDYEMRHGFGCSRCTHEADGLATETVLFVPRRDPVRITTLRIENRTDRRRWHSVFAGTRLVLGGLAPDTTGTLLVSADPAGDVLFATNPLAGEFADGVTFTAVIARADLGGVHYTGDREVFVGRDGSLERPHALRSRRLDGHVGPRIDPFLAHQAEVEIAPRGATEIAFLLGEATSREEARAIVARYRAPGAIHAALAEVRRFWAEGVGGITIDTPSRALDVMVNGWLPYQTTACRLWARTAFYQSGGAFGFRDQLQDAASLTWLWPERTREQILLHAAHQFVEGDVLHWWHPPDSRGIRTRFADDLLWLPALAADYVRATGDRTVLDERVRFLRARPLAPGEDETFLRPEDSGETADVYDHCCRALDRSLAIGPHGLPLFGTGDWNDGMNRVGREGRGESVWMAFFLGAILRDFAPLCRERGDGGRARRYEQHREHLTEAVERAAWDGEWYLRGYYDDGTALGSHVGDECRIDALVQAWSVLSGMAPPERAAQAMDSVERHLVSEEDRLIRLLAPPFESTPHDPGYIKGYVRGVRENGGQYTHAALWVVAAMARLGRRDRVAALLDLINPVGHAADEARVARYGLEPYVVAADVYGEPPHVGRGGWSWYTGSSGWMYRVALEELLGLSVVDGAELRVRPCIPDDWPGFTVTWRVPGGDTRYRVRVVRAPAGAEVAAAVDGAALSCEGGAVRVPLRRDEMLHEVEIAWPLGGAPAAAR